MAEIDRYINILYNLFVFVPPRDWIGYMPGRLMNGFFVVIAIVLFFPVILPISKDIVKIMWASMPLWAQLGIFIALALCVLAIGRGIWWAITGRSRFSRRRW